MLQLDGAALDMDGREFTYDIPAPFGPERGAAVLTIKARPMATVNASFRAALDKVMHKATVKDRIADDMFEASRDYDAHHAAQVANAKWVDKAVAELNYDHCVIEWSTTIQNGGRDMDPTRDNFIALSLFEHKAITKLVAQVRKDLADHDKFAIDAAKTVEAAEIKN